MVQSTTPLKEYFMWLINVQELSDALTVTPKTFHQWAESKQIPRLCQGNKNRAYQIFEIVALLGMKKTPPFLYGAGKGIGKVTRRRD